MNKKRIKMSGLAMIFLALASLSSCDEEGENTGATPSDKNYKQEMRDFVQDMSVYAKGINPNFVIIPQNGAEIVSTTGDDIGSPEMSYINAIDGIGQESLFYGYSSDNQGTPIAENEWMRFFLDMAKDNGTVKIMVTDYCSTHSKMDNSNSENSSKAYLSFAADHRELDNIPDYPNSLYHENADTITNLQDAQNFLYLINPDNGYASKQEFVNAIKNTNYDYIIMDYFFEGEEYTSSQIEQLRQKANGGQRLLICYMSIGEAENYRYYWQSDWAIGNPSFIEKENPNWRGNFVVRYWEPEWKNIIFGNDSSYLKKILNAGFDGVYLDIIDAFEQFEQ